MNKLPDFINLPNEECYRKYYIDNYCNKDIFTFDGIKVKFYEDKFEHAFYESTDKLKGNKDSFSLNRAMRIDWIKYVLNNSNAILKIGWDKKIKKYDKNRRVAVLTLEKYVVVIRIDRDNTAKFMTAYYADTSINKILNAPNWV